MFGRIDVADETAFLRELADLEAIVGRYMSEIADVMLADGESVTPENMDRRIKALIERDPDFAEMFLRLGAARLIRERMIAKAH